MSDFFRRASNAFHRHQRQDSTDSTNAPKPSYDVGKPSEQEPLDQKLEATPPESHVNEVFADTSTGTVSLSSPSSVLVLVIG